jgi:enoyl-CoA hydratase/carnithine racemase
MLSTYLASALPTTPTIHMSEIVQRERHGAVALLRLNRPEALNALSDDVLAALCAELDLVDAADEVRCVVLSGAGRAFAAGADVAGLREMAAGDVLAGERGRRWERLPRASGRSLALEVILGGRTLSAREALMHGICSRVVAPEALEREALALAGRIADRPALAVRLAREAVRLAFELPLEAGLTEERRLFAEAFATDDAREGMDAFIDRRPPVWSHSS